nr:hypothetical protein [Tanacetum cinerariifolium]
LEEGLGALNIIVLAAVQIANMWSVKEGSLGKSNLIVCVEEDVFKIEANLFCSNKELFSLWRILLLVSNLIIGLFEIAIALVLSQNECTFDIHLIDYEVHVSGKGRKDPDCFKSCNWSIGLAPLLDKLMRMSIKKNQVGRFSKTSVKCSDDPIIVVDDSDEDEEADKVHATTNAETEDTSVPKSSSPSGSLPIELKKLPSKFNELAGEIKCLKKQVHDLEIKLQIELKEIPTKLADFTKTVTSLTSQVAKLKTLQ